MKVSIENACNLNKFDNIWISNTNFNDNTYLLGLGSFDFCRYKLCGGGVEVVIYSLGGIIQSICAPNNDGVCADIALGYDTPQGTNLSARIIPIMALPTTIVS